VSRYWIALPGAEISGGEVEVTVEESPAGLGVTAAGGSHRVDLIEIVPGVYTLIVDGRTHDLQVADGAAGRVVTVDGRRAPTLASRAPRRRAAAGVESGAGAEVRAPMPGLLVALQAAPGARVGAGEAVAIMEAMKMQMEIRAPQPGTVARVHVRPGQELAAGQLIMTME
jgi:biotin carboxyl carrier protein